MSDEINENNNIEKKTSPKNKNIEQEQTNFPQPSIIISNFIKKKRSNSSSSSSNNTSNINTKNLGHRCTICLEYDKYSEKKCQKCFVCNSYYHKKCYEKFEPKFENLNNNNKNNILCLNCIEKKTTSKCILCGREIGIKKKLNNGNYIHNYCIKFIKEYNETQNEIRKWRFNQKCKFCKNNNSNIPIIKCQNTKCKNYYHIQCAIKNKIIFSLNFMKDFYKISDDETIPFYCSLHYKTLAKEYNDFIKQMDVFLGDDEENKLKILDSSLNKEKKEVKIVKFNRNFKKKIIFNSIKIEKKKNFNVVVEDFEGKNKIKKNEGKIFTAKMMGSSNNNNNNKNIFTSVVDKQKENEKKEGKINENNNINNNNNNENNNNNINNNNSENNNNNNNNENNNSENNNNINNNNNENNNNNNENKNNNEKIKEEIKKILLEENLFEAFAETNKNNMEPRIFHKIIF